VRVSLFHKSRFSDWRRIAARLAIWALVLQVLAPVAQAVEITNSDDPLSRDLLVICTAYGVVQQDKENGANPYQSLWDCPACQLHEFGGIFPPVDSSAFSHRLITAWPCPASSANQCGSGVRISSQGPRAPPLGV